MNVGKNKTSSQAGYCILLVDNRDGKFLEGKESIVTVLNWKTHKIKRKVRSTLAAETMAAIEACESGDIFRAHLLGLRGADKLTLKGFQYNEELKEMQKENEDLKAIIKIYETERMQMQPIAHP